MELVMGLAPEAPLGDTISSSSEELSKDNILSFDSSQVQHFSHGSPLRLRNNHP